MYSIIQTGYFIPCFFLPSIF